MTRINEEGGGVATVAPGAATPANTIGMGNPVLPDGDQVGSEPYTAKAQVERVKKRKKKKSIAEIVEGIFDQEDLGQNQDVFSASFKTAIEEHDIKSAYQALQLFGKPVSVLRKGDFFIELSETPNKIRLKIGRVESAMFSVLTELIFMYKSPNKVVVGSGFDSVKSQDYTLPRPMLIKTSKAKNDKLLKKLMDIYDL